MASNAYIRLLLSLLVTVAIIGVSVLLYRNASDKPAVRNTVNQQLPQNVDIALKKARFSEMQDGVVAWELVAENVNYDKTGDKAYLKSIRMIFKGDGAKGAITVTADSGEYSSTLKNVLLNGNVHVASEDGASFETASIIYTGASGQLSTEDSVTFMQQRMKLTATGMDFGVKKQLAHFHSAIVASIVPD
ncbi:MAG: LPS export ABC transporter periplasmic protein LptC [Desulfuromonadaceae bacterium]|nr:LPS export ABC transporter periplasmic protein LptC [Desulfuromonadaceae bacterium]MDD2856151.1 LPS export ABC transporter periplasmic protein LptC [Desulfuromonadaceae bacterium]